MSNKVFERLWNEDISFETKIVLLQDEIIQVKNEKLRLCIERIIDITPGYYFLCPSSSTGFFHPKDELFLGGQVLHNKKCVRLADEAARRYDLSALEVDMLKTAAIVHDMPYKFYYDKDSNRFRCNKNHHNDNAAAFISVAKTVNLEELVWNPIANAISHHMGRWGIPSTELIFNDTRLISPLQEIDFYSSRPFVNVNISDRRVFE